MKTLFAKIMLVAALTLAVAPVAVLAAGTTFTTQQTELCTSAGNKVLQDAGGNDYCATKDGKTLAGGANNIVPTIINLLLYVAGAIAVIVIIFGGIRYVISTGDAARIKSAKDTILYAVIGLIVAILAYAIVNTVIFQLGG
jgi:hypothetical protein